MRESQRRCVTEAFLHLTARKRADGGAKLNLPLALSYYPRRGPYGKLARLEPVNNLIACAAYLGAATHIVAGASNNIDQKQHEAGEKRRAAVIWVTHLNRCQDMIQKGSYIISLKRPLASSTFSRKARRTRCKPAPSLELNCSAILERS